MPMFFQDTGPALPHNNVSRDSNKRKKAKKYPVPKDGAFVVSALSIGSDRGAAGLAGPDPDHLFE